MAVQDDMSDPWAIIRELVARVEILERQSPLENASITSGPGIRVATPEGIRGAHKDSVSIEVVEGFKIKPGASGKVDAGAKIDVAGEVVAGGAKITAEGGGKVTAGAAQVSSEDGGKVGAGGTWVNSDGVIRSDGNKVVIDDGAEIRGPTRVIGQMNADSMVMTYKGVRHPVDTVVGWLQDSIDGTHGIATGAQSTAGTALANANSALSQLSGKASQSEVDTVQEQMGAIKVKINALIDAHNAKHPDAPVAKF